MNRSSRKSNAASAAALKSSSTSQRPSAISSTSSSSTTSGAIQTLVSSYRENTPARLKLIDAFCVFLVVLGVLQFVYCIAVTNFPFNSFIAGFSATVGQFVLAASLRIQANKANQSQFKTITPERAFADFLIGSIILHFFVVNFLG